jgi:hypothetical protein
MKKYRTLKEAAWVTYPHVEGEEALNAQNSEGEGDFIEGEQWQQERSYSEEEVLEIIHNLT